MCDPVSASVALLAASAGANYLGNKAVERKQNSYQGWENARQSGYMDQIMNTVGTQTNKFAEPQFAQDLASKRQGLTDAFTQAISENNKFMPGAGVLTGPKIVADDATKQLDKSNTYTSQQAAARGALESLGSLLSDRNIDLARSAGQTRTIGNFMQGSANILPLEMQAANSAGDKHRLVADLFQAAGSAGLQSGLATPAGPSAGGIGSTAIPGATGAGGWSAKPLTAKQMAAKGITFR